MQFDFITCPHCGLLCDDLSVEVNNLSVSLDADKPSTCKNHFEDASLDDGKIPTPSINGVAASTKDALQAASRILTQSKQPLISGMIGDVQTCRNAIALAEKVGGVADHANGSRMRANSATMQRLGEVKTTLAEVRNRADCVVILGSNVLNNFPRLYERILCPEKALRGESAQKKNIFVLDIDVNCDKSQQSKFKNITFLNLEASSIEEIVQRLLGIVNQKIKTANNNNYITQALSQLHQVINSSQYTTIIWSTAEFKPDTCEQTLQSITQLIKVLMSKQRVVGLTLGGSKAEITATQVSTWQTGVPLPVAFMTGAPVHDPLLFDGMKMLQNNEVDSLLWVATYSSNDTPPNTDIPTIVIGHPKMQCSSKTDVFIPAGVPGIDHRGLACRTDNVATLPLMSIRNSKLLSASEIIKQLTQLL